MKFIHHDLNNDNALEIISDDILIECEQDAVDLMFKIEYEYNSKTIILYKNNFCEDFYILKTRLAGLILQKFINYKFRLIIIGEFNNIDDNLKSFIYESNKNKKIMFLKDISTALKEVC